MGVGDPLEAAYKLRGAVSAGSWHLIGDGEILEPCDIRYDVLWRTARAGSPDVILATFSHHYDVPTDAGTIYDAVPYEADAVGIAAPASPGDRLVLRYTVTSQHPPGTRQFIPNGDGAFSHGRIPQLVLPTP